MKINRDDYIKADAESRGKILAKTYGLAGHQMWKHKQSGKWIISHAGIQSIAAQENIIVEYDVIIAERDFAVVQANIKDGQSTFGEASKGNCKMAYFMAMAEKRGFDRAVLIHILRHVGGYGADFYGEDEADDFKEQPTAEKKTPPGPFEAAPEMKRRILDALKKANTEANIEEIRKSGLPIAQKGKWFKEFSTAIGEALDRIGVNGAA